MDVRGIDTDELGRSRRRRCKRGLARLDDEKRVRDGLFVHLASRWIETDRVHVDARRQPLASHHRLGRVSGRGNYVGASDRFLVRANCPGLRPDLLRERLGSRPIASCDPDLGEPAHARKRAGVRTRLHAGADERQHLCVVAREQAGGERRARSGTHRCDVPPIHQCQWRAVLGVEDRDHRLVRVQVDVLREQRDELAGQPCGRKIGRHHPEQSLPLLHQRGDARRHRGLAGAELSMRGGQCIDELVEVEELPNLPFREEDQDSRFSRPRACWFQRTR